jgi:chromosome segregation ATPase
LRLTSINTGFGENVRARELEISQIRTRMLELEESLGTHDATINTLRGNIRTLEFEMEAKQQYIDSIERTSISLQETINSKDIRIRELEIALSKARNELAVCENDDQKIILE